MKNFEEKLYDLKVPKIDDEQHKNRLRRDLIKRFVNTGRNYKLQFKIAAVTASIFALFIVFSIVKPNLTRQIYEFAFNKGGKQVEKPLPGSNSILLDDALKYTSIENPIVAKELDSQKYKEGKTYLIRRYISQDKSKITIVSEIDPHAKKGIKIKKVY